MTIECVSNLLVFFQETLRTAEQTLRVHLHPETENYLSTLLDRFASGRLALGVNESLVLTLDRALASGTGQQCIHLQTVGDGALCTLAFFGPQIERMGVSSDLYVDLGSFAYGRAAQMLTQPGGSAPIVLAELNERFPTVVDVIAEVAESAALGSMTKELVRKFDRMKNESAARDALERARALSQIWARNHDRGSA